MRVCFGIGFTADLLATVPLLFAEIATLMLGLPVASNDESGGAEQYPAWVFRFNLLCGNIGAGKARDWGRVDFKPFTGFPVEWPALIL